MQRIFCMCKKNAEKILRNKGMRKTEETPLRKRMIALCEAIGVSPNKLSLEMGKSRDYLRSLGSVIGSDQLQYIYCNYPQVNLAWIITGEGDMIIDKDLKKLKDLKELVSLYAEERKLNLKLQEEKDKLQQENASLKAELERMKPEYR